MQNHKSILGFIGIGLGSIALLLAIFHFWAGPFSPQLTFEQTVAKKVVSIKQATITGLKGEKLQAPESSSMNTDQIVSFVTASLGGLAIIFGIIGFARKEPLRVTGVAALLGSGAIALQFFIFALGILALAILVGFVLSQIGIG